MNKTNETPQLEKGFLRIASGEEENDILTALVKARLSSTEYQIVLLVIRKTYGWNKKEDWISLTQFSNYTSKTRRAIFTSIKSLVKKNILVKKTSLGKTALYGLNKNFNEWKTLVKKTSLVKKNSQTSEKNFTSLVKNFSPTKDIYTKDNNIIYTPPSSECKKSSRPKKKDISSSTVKNYTPLSSSLLPKTPQAELVEYFSYKFNQRFKKPYKPFKSDYINIAELLKTYTPDQLKKYIGWYIYYSDNHWWGKKGYTIGNFYRYINHIISSGSPYSY